MCAKLRTVAASKTEVTQRDHSIIDCSRHIHIFFVLRAHPVRGESHNQRNTTGEVATVRRLQQQTQAMPINLLSPKRKSNAWY